MAELYAVVRIWQNSILFQLKWLRNSHYHESDKDIRYMWQTNVCLKYEQETYEHLLKKTPKIDAVVQTPDEQGVVIQVNLLKGIVRVKLDNEQSTDIIDYSVKDIR